MRRKLSLSAAVLTMAGAWVGTAGTGVADDAGSVLPKIQITDHASVNAQSGEEFLPRGANYIDLARNEAGLTYHSLFEPGAYDPQEVRRSLSYMQGSGYNVVRVFIDHGSFVDKSTGISAGIKSEEPIRDAYMDNVVDFIKAAADRGIYTVPSLDGIPANRYYYRIVGTTPENIKGNNLLYLHSGHIAAKAEYVKQFAEAFLEHAGERYRTAILAYQADNELHFRTNLPPYDKMSGSLTAVNGLTYDMSDPAQRQHSADASMVAYSHRVKEALVSVDPQAHLSIGFFSNAAVGKGGFDGFKVHCSRACRSDLDYRYPGRPAALSIYGQADLIDLHAYPRGPKGGSYSLRDALVSLEYRLISRPFIIGEIGAKKSHWPSVGEAARAMRNAQKESCGYGAKGWLFWTWNTTTTLAHQSEFHNLVESNGAINGQLAPVARPDPCV